MRELTLSEVQEVNGGAAHLPPMVVWGIGYIASHAVDAAISRYVSYWEEAVANGWGQNVSAEDLEPGAGFGTL